MPTIQKPIAKTAARPAAKPIAKAACAHPVEPPPLCTQCQNYYSAYGAEFCASRRNGYSLVNGAVIQINPAVARQPGRGANHCGPEGRNYLPRQPEAKRAWWKF
jgi:hypothetical protein